MTQGCWLIGEPDPYASKFGVTEMPHPGPCTCNCHGNEAYVQSLRARGLHVHEWTVKVYELEGKTRKLGIKCRGCPMQPPPAVKSHIIRR